MFKQSNDRSSETGRRSDSVEPAISQKLPEKSTYKRQYPLSAFNNFSVRMFGYYKRKALWNRNFCILYIHAEILLRSDQISYRILLFYFIQNFQHF